MEEMNLKKLIAFVLVLVLCLSLAACAISNEELVGVWVGEWNYEGNNYKRGIVFNSDGSYVSVLNKNGSLHESEEGTYEIDGKNVDLHPDGDQGHTTPFKYRSGKLYNGDNKYIKQTP